MPTKGRPRRSGMSSNVQRLRRRFALRRRLNLSGDADLGSDKPGLIGLGQNDVVRTLLKSASLTWLLDIAARTLASNVLLCGVGSPLFYGAWRRSKKLLNFRSLLYIFDQLIQTFKCILSEH